MSRNCNLSTQTGKHFIVIRKNKEIPLKVITDFLDMNYKEYALIVHKSDKDPTTGEIIPVHYHYVGNCTRRDIRLSTLINELSTALKCDKQCISADKYNSLELSLQYLIHKNNPEKTPHKLEEIKFKGWTLEELKTFITADSTGINFDRVYNVCKNSTTIVQVIRELGFGSFHHYRSTIWDIWNCLHPNNIKGNVVD